MGADANETAADLHRLFTGLSRLASRTRSRNVIHPGIHNLARTDAWPLSHLAATGLAWMSAPAEWQAVDHSTMTAQVECLKCAGLTRRHIDPTDRRASIVTLTRDGGAICNEIRKEASAFFSGVPSDRTSRQRRGLIESIVRLSITLEKHLD